MARGQSKAAVPVDSIRIGQLTVEAVVHRAEEGGYWAEVPALPGCFTEAETLQELRRNLRDAIELYLAAPASTKRAKAR